MYYISYMDKLQLIEIILDNSEFSDSRKKINQKRQLKKIIENKTENTESLLLNFMIYFINEKNLHDTIINMATIKQLTNAEIRKLIKEHNDFVKIKIPTGANKKILVKVVHDNGFKLDHKNKQLVKLSGSILKKPKKEEKKKLVIKSNGEKEEKEYYLSKKEKEEKLKQSDENEKQKEKAKKEVQRKKNARSQFLDEFEEIVPEIKEFMRKKTLNESDFKSLRSLLEDLHMIRESYIELDIEEDIPKKLIKAIIVVNKMLSAKKSGEAKDMKVKAEPLEKGKEFKSLSSKLPERKGKKPLPSKPIQKSLMPSKPSDLPARKTRGKLVPKKKKFAGLKVAPQLPPRDKKQPPELPPRDHKPKFKIDPSKQPKQTPSKIKMKYKPPSSTMKITPKPKEEEQPQEEDIDIDNLSVEDRLDLLHEFLDKYKNDIDSEGQDIFSDSNEAQRVFVDTFEEIKKESLDHGADNNGFQGTSSSVSKRGIKVLNLATRWNGDGNEGKGISLITKNQPFRHFIRWIGTESKKAGEIKKDKGKKGITKEELVDYKGYSLVELRKFNTDNNLSSNGSKLNLVNRLLNNDIVIEKKGRKKNEKQLKQEKKEKDIEELKGLLAKLPENVEESEGWLYVNKNQDKLTAFMKKHKFKDEQQKDKFMRISQKGNAKFRTDLTQGTIELLTRDKKVHPFILDQKEKSEKDDKKERLRLAVERQRAEAKKKPKEKPLSIKVSEKKEIPQDYEMVEKPKFKIDPSKQPKQTPSKIEMTEKPFGFGKVEFKKFMQDIMDKAQEEQEEDEEEEEELTPQDWKNRDERLVKFVGGMKLQLDKLRPKIAKMTDKKEIRLIRKEIQIYVNDFMEEYNVIFDDDLDDILIQKAVGMLRDEAMGEIKKKDEEKRYVAQFGGMVGHSTDPDGNRLEWRTLREYNEIAGAVHKRLLHEMGGTKIEGAGKYDQDRKYDRQAIKKWEDYFAKELPADRDEWYKRIDKHFR